MPIFSSSSSYTLAAIVLTSGGGSGASARPLRVPTQPLTNPPLIMVIDDSLVVRRVVEVSFARIGIPVVAYPDGLSAFNAMVKHEAPVPDLLLLDIGLPKMDGYKVARIMRAHPELKDLDIVMLTGRDSPIDWVLSKLVGARDFIHKPFRPGDLVTRVCNLLGISFPS